MTYHHLGPWSGDSEHYDGVPAKLPARYYALMPAALVASLPSMTDDPTQDELG